MGCIYRLAKKIEITRRTDSWTWEYKMFAREHNVFTVKNQSTRDMIYTWRKRKKKKINAISIISKDKILEIITLHWRRSARFGTAAERLRFRFCSKGICLDTAGTFNLIFIDFMLAHSLLCELGTCASNFTKACGIQVYSPDAEMLLAEIAGSRPPIFLPFKGG